MVIRKNFSYFDYQKYVLLLFIKKYKKHLSFNKIVDMFIITKKLNFNSFLNIRILFYIL